MFRTLAVRDGQPLNWARHFRLLAADCARLGIEAPAEQLLRDELLRIAPADHAAKVIVTRGAQERGYVPRAGLRPTRIVAAFPMPAYPAKHALDGVEVRRCALVLSEQPRYAGAKTLNRLENVLARAEWDEPGIAEGLLADAAGRVIEGTMSNLFVVRGGAVATPRLDRCGVVGAQRERVRDLLGARAIECIERDISWGDVARADEIFLTNSLIGAWPVARFEGRGWTPGPIFAAVRQALAEADARP